MRCYDYFFGFVILSHVQCDISLRALSKLYFPSSYGDGTPIFEADGPMGAEQLAYDNTTKIIYTVGGAGFLHFVDISNPNEAKLIGHTDVGMETIDLSFCGGYIAVVARAKFANMRSKVLIYERYNAEKDNVTKVNEIEVGFQSSSYIQFLSNCQTILVSNEGEAGKSSNGTFFDPEGSVSIIRFSTKDLSGNFTNTEIGFTQYNSRWNEFVAKGVRYVFRNSTFSQDLEPEFMAINSDETIAYVSLQENNAIAVLNISANAIEGIHGLGRKDWSKSRFDASDKDGGINMQPWAVYGLYQPDNIRLMQFKGEDYIVTANEGDKKSYKMDDDGIDWSESTRAKKIAKDLDGSRGEAFREAMTDDKKLGRLTVSSIDGKNGTNKYKDIYTYGGRSFSIFKMVDLSLIYDSDDNIEQQHANSSLYGRLFNCDNYEASKTPVETFDKRSDNAGPDTESAEVATVGDTVYIFIGNERTSSIMIYSVSGDSIEPKFEGIHRAGGQETKYDMLYSQRNTGDLDPEGLNPNVATHMSTTRRPINAYFKELMFESAKFDPDGFYGCHSDIFICRQIIRNYLFSTKQ
ncbi:unnamed protein product [Owenia fusiformis]|uniref:Choice-of-anchor I domain-containing protein n=1 Tax=Owenia fusiformis TaxID=6347 RepID=A0A8J1Y913_OWEFU|nr:unnamed protein product [Owenia fusiformis]